MTKLSITLAIACLTVTLAPAVHAYGQGPEASGQDTSIVSQVNVLFQAAEKANEGQCSVGFAPELVTLLGLDRPQQSQALTNIALACHAE